MAGRSTQSLEVIRIVPWIQEPKRRSARVAALVYGLWAFVWVAYAVIGVGEASIGAHLVLALTGAPLSLVTLYMPNATMPAIVTAALLGIVQWGALGAWLGGVKPVVLATKEGVKHDL